MKLKYFIDDSVLNIWSDELAYLVGWTIGDGNVFNRNVSWELKDLEPLTWIKSFFKTDMPIRLYTRKNGRQYYKFIISRIDVVNKFIDLGIYPNKSLTVRLPKIPEQYISHFLRGLFEADGSLLIRKGGGFNKDDYIRLDSYICNGSKEFINDLFLKIGFGRISNKNSGVYRIEFSCTNAVKFLNLIYKDSEGMRLNRKYNIWQEFLNTNKIYN